MLVVLFSSRCACNIAAWRVLADSMTGNVCFNSVKHAAAGLLRGYCICKTHLVVTTQRCFGSHVFVNKSASRGCSRYEHRFANVEFLMYLEYAGLFPNIELLMYDTCENDRFGNCGIWYSCCGCRIASTQQYVDRLGPMPPARRPSPGPHAAGKACLFRAGRVPVSYTHLTLPTKA